MLLVQVSEPPVVGQATTMTGFLQMSVPKILPVLSTLNIKISMQPHPQHQCYYGFYTN